MSLWGAYITGRVIGRLQRFVEVHPLGWVLAENAGYQCFADAPDKVRRPDASFLRSDRISFAQAMADGYITITPDLAVEVVSPTDRVYDVDAKVEEYLRAGGPLVWVINPEVRTIEVHRRQGQGIILHETDELDGGDVLPGFRCPVRDLFQPPVATGTSAPA